jgi:hypothetical protein
MNESELARLEQLGRQIETTGESYLGQLYNEGKIQELQHKKAQLVAALDLAGKKNPDDPQIPRGIARVAEIDTELCVLRAEHLRVTPVCRQFPN